MKTPIFGFIEGVAGAISGLLPMRRSHKKTVSHKTGSPKKRSAGRARAKRRYNKTRRVRPGTRRTGNLRTEPEAVEAITNKLSVTSVARTVVCSCPACGLQAPESLMAEHFGGSPTHEHSPVQQRPETDHRVEEAPAAVLRDADSQDSLRNLLKILSPARAFGRRREQRTINPIG
ncbi:MAG TPA: hypothetical protein VNA15_04265, partial [Candidatus Angelobacter sp.]|nr:hypothetical protein [Candidatus Angelobacter sp.]